ncbi:MAG: CRISPR system precrRNA processing endoribonuclease RAMP protein Cas6 [Anaerolineales bacterium]|nr:CRISPR system precrRNA processing endoribonuclease RAMP protein Cas6 [Anaerolineales bacterium]
MLISVLIHLTAQQKISLPAETGSAIRAELLKWTQKINPAHSAQLHNGNALRPYTLSDLQGDFRFEGGHRVLKEGDQVCFRLTSLSAADSQLLLNEVLPQMLGKSIQLAHQKFVVQEKIEVQQKTSYQELLQKNFDSTKPAPALIDVAFDSPTTFNVDNGVMPLPVPVLIFNSWLARWNQFAEVNFSQDIKKIDEALLSLSRFQKLRSQAVTLTKGSPESPKKIPLIGFTGLCRFRINSNDSFWLSACHTLTEFSTFCGTGTKTSYGLGQTRIANELDWKNSRNK